MPRFIKYTGLPSPHNLRFASKKAAGSTKNQGSNTRGKHLGAKRREGTIDKHVMLSL